MRLKKRHAASRWRKAVCFFSHTCTMPHFLPDPIMKQCCKSCTNILQRNKRVLCEGELFTPWLWGCEGGMKDGVWSCRTSFPSELIPTDKLTQWAAERLGERRAQGAGVRVRRTQRQRSLDAEHLRGFSWLGYFPLVFMSGVKAQTTTTERPQRDIQPVFRTSSHMWYSCEHTPARPSDMKQSHSFHCGFVRFALAKWPFPSQSCSCVLKVASAQPQHKLVFTFDSLWWFSLIHLQEKRIRRSAHFPCCWVDSQMLHVWKAEVDRQKMFNSTQKSDD